VLISDLSGRSNIFFKLKEKGLEELLDDGARRELLDRIKQMEYEGYELESAEGSFELLVREVMQPDHFFFELESMTVVSEKTGNKRTQCKVDMTVRARDGSHSAQAKASGPFHAMAECLRKCLAKLDDGRRFGRRARSELERAGRFGAPGAVAARRARQVHGEERRVLGRLTAGFFDRYR
jgi:hypothetical protein